MDDRDIDRRRFLQRTGWALGAGAVLPLLGAAPDLAAATPGQSTPQGMPHEDPDQLLREGRFDEAERAFRRRLRRDPNDAHAAAQVGYIALLSNRFADAEEFLAKAVSLAPEDSFSQMQLGDCFVRQDQLARAVGPLRASGTPDGTAHAEQYAAINGTPWQVHGAESTRIPFQHLDPLPIVEARVNGSEPKPFLLDTGAATPGFSTAVAEEAGLQPVATLTASAPGQTFTMYLGVLGSFQMGDVELRNVPVHWMDARWPAPPDGPPPVGAFGTTTFYHFLTTMDYANQALILRPKTRAELRRFRLEARRAHPERLPLWLGGDHFPCTLGSLRDYGPKVVSFDTGGSRIGVTTLPEIAERAGIEVDYEHPETWGGRTAYPIVPDEISLGRAVGRNVRGLAGPLLVGAGLFKFDTIANFTHDFFKPFAVTMDFLDMHLYITGESLRPGG